jgi:hypothetical protein
MELPLWRKLRKVSRTINKISDLIHAGKLEFHTQGELEWLIQTELKIVLRGCNCEQNEQFVSNYIKSLINYKKEIEHGKESGCNNQ